MNIHHYERVGDSYIAVSSQNAVVGVLRWIDDQSIIRPPTDAKNRDIEARINKLTDKHRAMDRKRTERRREVNKYGR